MSQERADALNMIIRNKLVNNSAVTNLVPTSSIIVGYEDGSLHIINIDSNYTTYSEFASGSTITMFSVRVINNNLSNTRAVLAAMRAAIVPSYITYGGFQVGSLNLSSGNINQIGNKFYGTISGHAVLNSV